MDNNEKTKSGGATTKTDDKTVQNKANAAPSAQGGNKTTPNQSGDAAANQGGGASQSIGDAVSGATDTIKDALGAAKEKGGAVASQAYGIAAQKATEAIDERKANFTQGLTSVADTIRQIGGNLSEAQEPTGVANIAAQYTNTAADKVEQLTGYLERRDFKGLVRDLEDLAHKNPAIFLGGAFALGIIAARFIKSGNSESSQTRRRISETSGGGGESGGVRVRQLRRKSTGKADTLNTSDDFSGGGSSFGAATENRGG